MSLARMLDQHPLCHCLHEPHPILIKLAAEWQHGCLEADELRRYLAFKGSRMFQHRVGPRLYGESDQKLSFLIFFLAEFGRSTKFVWLIRDGRDVVASMVARDRVYTNHRSHLSGSLWYKYRLRGDRCRDVAADVWDGMTDFQKCCWSWSYANRTIARSLEDLDARSWIQVRLEELADHLPSLLRFLDLPFYPVRVLHANASETGLRDPQAWSKEEKEAFDRWCGQGMDRWYPGWRAGPIYSRSSVPVCSKGTDAARAIRSHIAWLLGKLVDKAVRGVGCA